MDSEYSVYFRKPVDPIKEYCPDYYDVIKNPMDLTTIKGNIERGFYKNAESIYKDVELILKNAKQYNPVYVE